MSVVAGVDSSTQSCTVELRDADTGALLGSGRAPHPPTSPPVSEQRAEDWWTALGVALAAACGEAGVRASDVAALSVAAQCHGAVLQGADGSVLRPVKLWNDTTSAPQAERMRAALGVGEWAQAVGSAPTAAFTITKLAWLAEHEPEVLAATRTVLLPHDHLTYRLTARAVTDRSEASGTGYYAAHEGRWRTDLLERFVDDSRDWDAVLPEVLGPSSAAGPTATADAAALGLSPSTLVGAGAGDQHAGALGIGLAEGEVAYSLGTSGVVLTTAADPVHDEAGFVNGVADAAGGYLPLVCTLNSTKVTDWVARLLDVDHATLASLALSAPVRPDRPVFAAFLDGERTPDRPGAMGLLGGLTGATSRADLALAAVEGVLLGLVRGHRMIQRNGAEAAGDVVVLGGGARSQAYRQVLADLLGRPVTVRDASEATARGACIQAAAVLHGVDVTKVRDAWRPATLITTDPQRDRSDVLERYLTLADWDGLDRPAA
ncbi:xylulokinase [Cellulomonas endophytica]|uniref:xylulokinase n=1 Tax=Cellulomonas endophytica TaxID=2494735 RepID=UPI001012A994|nr:xylulokinase [Cellulomonas endophytica]